MFTFTDNSAAFISELENVKKPAMLEAIGLKAVAYTKANITAAGRKKTGRMVNSVTHRVIASEDTVYIGSNVEYFKYNELGTGRYAEGGAPGYWVYVAGQDEATRAAHRRTSRKRYTLQQAKQIVAMMRAKGLNAFYTDGMKPTHALQKAVSEHKNVYKQIIKITGR